jgi:hypothetical protein
MAIRPGKLSLLVYSSSLFLISSIVSYNRYKVISILLSLLYISSSIHHYYCYRWYIIGLIDRSLAHIITILCLYNSNIYSLVCILYVLIVYYKKIYNKPLSIYYHCSIHIVSNLGVLLLN